MLVLLESIPNTITFKKDYVKLKCLEKNSINPSLDDATSEMLCRYVKAHLINNFSIVLFTGITGNVMAIMFLSLLKDFQSIPRCS
jgi:hypothetical protein